MEVTQDLESRRPVLVSLCHCFLIVWPWASHIASLKLVFSLLVMNHNIHFLLGIMAELTVVTSPIPHTLLTEWLGHCFWGMSGVVVSVFFSPWIKERFVIMVEMVLWECQDKIIKRDIASTCQSWDFGFWNAASRRWGSSSRHTKYLTTLGVVLDTSQGPEWLWPGLLSHSLSSQWKLQDQGAEIKHFHCAPYKILTLRNRER